MSVPLVEKDVVTENNSNQSNNNRYFIKVVINNRNRRFHCHRGLQKTFVHYWYKLLIFLNMSCFCFCLFVYQILHELTWEWQTFCS